MNRKNIFRALATLPAAATGFFTFLVLYIKYRIEAFAYLSMGFSAAFVGTMWFLIVMPLAGKLLYAKIMTKRQQLHLQKKPIFRFLLDIEAASGEKNER